ncbi:E3 ubiquitin-protein ligase TTC3 [Genypterus blacodes]|uniref:E3 ubiquitin-protein ligase TTC3 n=1 Tax=Genypterus blacodes TaxID=154954 RepID=UPI003F76B645
MSDSDSDFDFGDLGDILHGQALTFPASFYTECGGMSPFHPPEEVSKRWNHIPHIIKKEAFQRMKVYTFWRPILLRREESNISTRWAVHIGLINSDCSEELGLKHLHKIEIVEAILRALDKGCARKDLTKQVMRISNGFNVNSYRQCSTDVLEAALHWLETTGEPDICHRIQEFGRGHICFVALHHIFRQFTYFIQDMGFDMDKMLHTLGTEPSHRLKEKCDEMKLRGNENFQKKQFDAAVKCYSRAIAFYPDNHIIYGNRALCYIRCKTYLKAVVDGKCATLIKPLWAKGHYRYCEALFCLGEVKKALEANHLAQGLCSDDPEGLKDLEQQQLKFITEMDGSSTAQLPKSHSKRANSANRGKTVESGPTIVKPPHSKDSEVKDHNHPGQSERIHTEGALRGTKSDIASKSGKEELNATGKKKFKNKNLSENESQKVADSKAGVSGALRTLVQDAHVALTDLRSRNAEQAFSQALASVENTAPKDLGLSTLDVMLLLFGRASALTDIGQPEELSEAQRLLEKMKSFEERTLQCLVYYAIGKVYLKENRFAVALEQFSNALQMARKQITPGKLTWPLTKDIIKETQQDYFMDLLENGVGLCKFPPVPDAICCLDNCLGPFKKEIYFTDPDFKGFIRISCCERCIVEYHIACWKTFKTTSFLEKNEKDFLQEACLTPDCGGQICNIQIFGPTGLVKCKFEAAITKPQPPKKPKVNQKCASVKKLKSKDEHRLRRKQCRQSFRDKHVITDDILQEKEDSASQSEQKVCLQYMDRVLLQISQYMELLRVESGLSVSALTRTLKPWLELDWSRGHQISGGILNWQSEPPETLGQGVELVLERKNRVLARVLIQLLSSCLDINPRLYEWACQLNKAGLNAAESFIERYSEHLQQLDLTVLLRFGPLQDVLKEKLGTRPELFSSVGQTAIEHLKQAPAEDRRLFIWTLEEHRNDYLSCHTILDEYFDMMDGHFSVLKKSNENQNNSPMKTKNRGRKKKQKEPKGVFAMSWMDDAPSQDEWDRDVFDEDDSLSFLHPSDPFSVPSHLQEQVADFEDQYIYSTHKGHYKKILDNNPDPTKESLYDYFDQILEEHGPLMAQDPLLVGELEHFPAEAQLKIEDAGGFEPFLLESLRFIKMGRCIGLAKHAVCLQQAGHGTSLDDLDIIEEPDSQSSSPPAFTSYLKDYLSSSTELHPVLPCPYTLGSQLDQSESRESSRWSSLSSDCTNIKQQHNIPYLLAGDSGQLDLDACKFVDGSCQTMEGFKKHEATQTSQETTRSVAVNTKVHKPFEISHGDINKKKKGCSDLEQQISNMKNDYDRVNLRHKNDISALEKEIQEISANIQVTNQELALFQQKLEEEVKKDQKEKKANQEVLKSLKLVIDELVNEQDSLIRNIQERKSSFEAKLNDFLELGNQSAAEKMSLEDEIKRCKDVLTKKTRRSCAAQLCVVESSMDQDLYRLHIKLTEATDMLSKLEEVAPRLPPQDLDAVRNTCRANIQDAQRKITTAQIQYQEQLDGVKNGRRASKVILVNVINPPLAVPPSVAANQFPPQSVSSAPTSSSQQAAPARGGAQAESPLTVFDRAMEHLTSIFPDCTRSDLKQFIQELRWSCGGSLSSMTLQDVVGAVSQTILDQQSNVMPSGSEAHATPPLNLASAWQSVGPQRTTHSNALNVEDPCIICHEDMNPDEICVLECRHSFHKKCIKSWLKQQSTCPTCRDHALLPEEFPMLPGRRRQAL